MKNIDWQKLKEVFNAAIDLPENERAAILEKQDPNLREKVLKLINADENANDFIVESAFADVGLVDENETDFYVGKQIDDYKILEEIGHGGMGTVYLASRSDETFDKKVAIKLIKRGMDTNAVLKRFVMERKILASLENPNIASLLDGGSTAGGLPYLVMEYIEGVPVTKFCDTHRFSIAERLELFRKVCSAISYAHQNLVVHRDIKPSNILVTKDGTPKLLDFGIAKLLHPDWSLETDEATATMFRLMTPEYASPEQVRGLAITTSSDIYSLGVVLYELLSGARPFKIESRLPQEIAQIVLTEEPIRPSAVSSQQSAVSRKTNKNEQQTTDDEQKNNPKSQIPNLKSLKGDLDNIILKALRKEPERRYQSVQEFSEDIRRHLTGLPVTATADTRIYRLGKFIKRHRAGVFAGLCVFLSLLMGISVATWQAVEARKERAKAEERFNDVRKLINSFLFEFEESIKDLQGATPAREMTVKKALEYLDILAREQSNNSSLQFELASAYAKIANIQGSPGRSNLGDTAGAVASYRKAIEILEKLLQIAPENRQFQKELASDYKSIAYIYEMTGEADLIVSSNQSALTLYQNLVSADENDFASKLELGDCYKSLGDLIASKGDLETALQNYRKTLEISETVLRSQPDDKRAKIMIMTASDAIGTTLGNPNFTNLGDTDGALLAHRRQLEICNELLAADEKSQFLQASRAFTLKVIGEVQTARKEWKNALENFKQSLEIQEKLVKNDAKDAFANIRLAYLLTNLGEALANTNQFDDALNHHDRAIEILAKLADSDKENSTVLLNLNRAYQKKGDALIGFGKPNEALRFYHKALKSNEEIAAEDPDNMDMRLQLANDYLQIARANVSLANKATDKKEEFLQEARKRFEQSKEVFLDMQEHNLRTKPISDILTEITKEIDECDKTLSKP
jgi:serine/threonine protein kinase/tetratricopeptide (TPR) repeat protein